MKYKFHIYVPVSKEIRSLEAALSIPKGAVGELHVFTLEVDQPISWMRNHADELAATIAPKLAPTALWLEAA